MKRRIIFILTLTHAALLISGFYVGKFVSFHEAMRNANFVGSVGATGMFHEYLRGQLEEGSCRQATEALLSYGRMLEQFKDRDGALIGGEMSLFDRVLTYVRLSKIAEKQGDSVRAKEYLSVARRACEAGKWTDCSENSIKEVTARIDRKVSIKCLSEAG